MNWKCHFRLLGTEISPKLIYIINRSNSVFLLRHRDTNSLKMLLWIHQRWENKQWPQTERQSLSVWESRLAAYPAMLLRPPRVYWMTLLWLSVMVSASDIWGRDSAASDSSALGQIWLLSSKRLLSVMFWTHTWESFCIMFDDMCDINPDVNKSKRCPLREFVSLTRLLLFCDSLHNHLINPSCTHQPPSPPPLSIPASLFSPITATVCPPVS